MATSAGGAPTSLLAVGAAAIAGAAVAAAGLTWMRHRNDRNATDPTTTTTTTAKPHASEADGSAVSQRQPLWMVIERFRGGDPTPVYARFRARGRLAPPDLEYVGSWVVEDLSMCYQVMRGSRADLEAWWREWSDVTDFEAVRVLTSPEAACAVAALS